MHGSNGLVVVGKELPANYKGFRTFSLWKGRQHTQKGRTHSDQLGPIRVVDNGLEAGVGQQGGAAPVCAQVPDDAAAV